METTNTMATTELERLARLEVLVEGLTRDQEQAARDRHETNKKLDELLALRHKGVGAFWLASSLVGTSIVGTVIMLIEWLRG